jgi:hypothetical protein
MKMFEKLEGDGRALLCVVLVGISAGACSAAEEGDGDTEPGLAVVQERAVSNRNVGMHCTDTYEQIVGLPPWCTPVGWTNCDRFAGEISKEAKLEFYYDLVNKAQYWHDAGDGVDNSLEDVDLFYSNTHGGAHWAHAVDWGMWNYDQRALSDQMKLGDERRGLSVLATYACSTAEWTTADSDSNGVWDTWQRWDSVFSGGLRVHLGSHDDVFAWGHEDIGKIFAQHLNSGYSFRDAWYYGLRSSAANNDVAVLYSGTDAADCDARRTGMSWDNFDTYPRRKSFGYLCATRWDDI